MGQPATQLTARVATVEILTYIGDLTQIISDPSEMIPHTFLKITDVNGNIEYVGFAPQQIGLVGTGEIFDNFYHPIFNSSGPISLSADQGDRLMEYVNSAIANPPFYNLPFGSQCAVWALNGVYTAVTGASIDLTIAATPENPLGVLGTLTTELVNPYTVALFNDGYQVGTQLNNAAGSAIAAVVSNAVDAASAAEGYLAGEYFNWAFTQTFADGEVLGLDFGELVANPLVALWEATRQKVGNLVTSTEFASNLVADNLFNELVTLNPELQTALQDAGAQVTQMSQDLAAAWDGFQTSLDAAGETVANDFLNFAMGLSESIEGIPESLLDQYNDMLAAQDGLVAILDAAGNSAEKQFLNLAIGLSDALSSTGESVLVSLSDLARALGNAMDGVNPWLQVFEFVSGTDPSLGGLINAVQGGFGAAEQTYSPLILDLDGDGVETLGQQSIIHFDHDKNGFSELTGWVGKDDGLLVLDRNGNGQIDDGGELFGNNTILANGSLASNGYKALMELDANQDGSIDISDSAYSTLRVWKDGNSDGAVDDGELMTLEQAGVESISTGYSSRPAHFDDFGNWVPNNPDDIDIYGNEHRQIGSFTKVGGSSGNTADVWFNVDMARTVDKDLITISAEIEALPEVAGFGNVHGLRQAMQRDTSGELKTLVSQLENETDFDVQYQLTSQILYHWAGVQGEDPNSRGIYLAGEALKLYTLEKFVGKEFVLLENVSSDTEGPIGAAVVRDTFSQLAFWAYSQIMTQTHFKPLLDSISLTANSDGSIGWGMSGVSDSLHSRYDTDPVEGMRYAALFVATLQSVIGSETNPVLDALRAEGNPNGTGFDLFLANLGPNVDYLGNNSSPISGSGDDVLFGLWGDDSLNGGAGDDQLFGDVGNDLLMGGQGDDQLYGHIGNDRLIGEEGNDTMTGGAGDDFLEGGAGNDTYVFGRGDGRDTIVDSDTTMGNVDTIKFAADLMPSDVTLWRDANNLYLGIDDRADTITVLSWFGIQSNRVEEVRFADGTVWGVDVLAAAAYIGTAAGDQLEGTDQSEVFMGLDGADTIFANGGADLLNGGAGNDSLYGLNGNDTLDGGAGNDWLSGGDGNDTYLFGSGDGQDTIFDEFGTDTIRLGAGLTTANVSLGRDSSNLFVGINGTADVLTVSGWFDASANRVESVQFEDGTIWNTAKLAAASFSGTSEADVIYGTTSSEALLGFAGDDYLYGDSGNDILDGGTGNDTLEGGAGNDTYYFGRDYGQDSITEVSGTDVIALGAGLTTNDVQIWRDSSNLYVGISGTADVLTVIGWYDVSANRVESIKFADGTIWNTATLVAAVFGGTSGNDALFGTTSSNTMRGYGGDDYLYGDSGSDILDGGIGNDTLEGGAGNDTYIFDRDYGQDTINEVSGTDVIALGAGLTTNDVQIWRDSSNLYVGINGTSDVLTVIGWYDASANRVESIKFADGTIWNTATLVAADFGGTSGADALYGTTGNNMMRGFGGDDILSGDAGNDTLDGGTGNDTLDGSMGNDTYLFGAGYGNDTIYEYSNSGNTDEVHFLSGIASDQIWLRQIGYNLEASVIGTADTLTVANWYLGSNYHVEQFKTADGKLLLDSQVENLVQAMAAFAPPSAGQTTLPTTYQDALAPVVAANWQ